jgi:hypothetical protein
MNEALTRLRNPVSKIRFCFVDSRSPTPTVKHAIIIIEQRPLCIVPCFVIDEGDSCIHALPVRTL